VVIEDIDSVIDHGYEDQLLTLLDGQETVNSVAFIATTNHLESLPARIAKRPSRFDRVIEVEAPGPNVRRQFLVKRGCGELSKKELERWVRLTDGLTIAHMKELIISVLLLENDLETEAERLRGSPIDEEVLGPVKAVPVDLDDEDLFD
jgi:cell division protease FtsH